MDRPKLPSEMHPDYPKGERWIKDGMNYYKPAPADAFIAFYQAHPEFANEGEYLFICEMCSDEIDSDLCYCWGCGDHSGTWVLYDENNEPVE